MKVTTTKKHSNAYGKNFEKKPGEKYEHPSPAALIKTGHIKAAEGSSVAGKSKG